MLNRASSSFSYAHISLALAGTMWVLPFLGYYHAYPLTTFYQEWMAAMLGLGAMLLLVSKRYWQQPEIPRIVLLPIGMLAIVVAQALMGKIAYLGQAMLYALYLLWAVLLVMLGRQLREEFGLAKLCSVLAAFLVIGTELSSLVGVLQHYNWHTFLDPVVTAKNSSAVYGNIAQPNHFADYLTLGLASLGLLYARGWLRGWQVVLLALPPLFVLPLSGSRSTWLYLLAIVGLAYWWQRRDKAHAVLLRYSLLLLLGFGIMHLVVQLPWLEGSGSVVTSAQRLFGEVRSGGIRLYLWREALLIFAQFPWFGAGFGQFAWQHFQLGPVLRNADISGLYNNAHNLFMQLAAETGLAGLSVLFATMLSWLARIRQDEQQIYHWWGYALLAVLGIHSLLEYPLWYAYFLGVAALLLGIFDRASYRLQLRNLGRLSVALMLLLGTLSLQQLLHGYRSIESLLAQRPASAHDQAYVERMRDGLLTVQRQLLLQPYADLFMNSMIEVSPEQIESKLLYNEAVLHFIPISQVAYREALLLAQAGKAEAAQQQMERAIWSYAGSFAQVRRELSELVRRDPAHFAALLKFAVQKNEERLHAIHTK